jgi:hypothetical protein
MGKSNSALNVLPSSGKKRRKQGGAGTKKHGRHLVHCARYRASGRREKNKERKHRKLLKFMEKKAHKKALRLGV